MDSLVNFRDIGGYVGKDGKRVALKRILRSGEVVGLSDEDKQVLINDYQLSDIVDFRGEVEVNERPDDSIDRVTYHHIDILGDLLNDDAGKSGLTQIDDPKLHMQQLYAEMVELSSAKKGYHDFFNQLLEKASGSTLFHCFAGKDRTGLGAALVLSILGVSQEDIFTDYLKTNSQRKEANDALVEEYRKEGYSAKELDSIEEKLYVRKEYLEEAFRVINENYGSVENYVIEGLDIPKESLKKLQDMYLVD